MNWQEKYKRLDALVAELLQEIAMDDFGYTARMLIESINHFKNEPPSATETVCDDASPLHPVVLALKERILQNMSEPVLLEGDEADLPTIELLKREIDRTIEDFIYDTSCGSCGEHGPKLGECSASKRICGHHCNCSWTHDECCWCGEEFGEVE